jgi:UDP-N-acetylglucosamine 2-epimerase (non-hydrolysing)
MDRIFFQQLALPNPKYNLGVGSGTHGKQTGEMLIGVEKILSEEMPDIVLVEGDTNTVLAGALAAVKLGIKVGHVEAGLRSYDRQMPEEVNRVLVDHCSDFLFAPTEKSESILLHEGISQEKVFMVGNTIVDAIDQNLEIANHRNQIPKQLGIASREYFLATVHRQENVDEKKRFKGIIEGLKQVQSQFHLSVIYPIHPRAQKRLKEFGLATENLTLIEPLDYLGFLQLENNAKLVLTDSGGVQEETCILGVPCVTMRDNTERPETVDVGSNILVGTNSDCILNGTKAMLSRQNRWKNPFGDGRTGKRIINLLWKKYGNK